MDSIPCPAPGKCFTEERELFGPYIPMGSFQTRYAGLRGQKGPYGGTKLAPRATPEPVPAPVMVGRLMTNAGTGAERP
jgi:hypothetical protein